MQEAIDDTTMTLTNYSDGSHLTISRLNHGDLMSVDKSDDCLTYPCSILRDSTESIQDLGTTKDDICWNLTPNHMLYRPNQLLCLQLPLLRHQHKYQSINHNPSHDTQKKVFSSVLTTVCLQHDLIPIHRRPNSSSSSEYIILVSLLASPKKHLKRH
jgi:hypothetical protein